MKIEFKPNRDANSREVHTNIPENFAECAKVFSESEMYFFMKAAMVVKAQGILRAHEVKLAAEKESELPKDWIDAVRPTERETQESKTRRDLAKLGDDVVLKMLRELEAKIKGKK